MCKRYLSKQNCVLWGQYFDISDEDGLEKAASWLAEVIKEVYNS